MGAPINHWTCIALNSSAHARNLRRMASAMRPWRNTEMFFTGKRGPGQVRNTIEETGKKHTRQGVGSWFQAINCTRYQLAHHILTIRHNKSSCFLLHSSSPEYHWKLSNFENYSRMRPKLVPNYLFATQEAPITIKGSPIENVEGFTYLGSKVSQSWGADEDIAARIKKTRQYYL